MSDFTEAEPLTISQREGGAPLGILPLGQVRDGNYGLPGLGEKRDCCGDFYTVGCLNIEEHPEGQAFVRVRKFSCKRPVCPECWKSWAVRESRRIAHRMLAWSVGRPIHFMVSPPKKLWYLPLEKLRSKAYRIAEKVGFLGGSCIPHHVRLYSGPKGFKEAVFSPHFHMIGYGWIKHTKREFETSGWICKNLGIRISVGATAFYQLTHCAVWYGEGRKHTVTWFGRLSYNKLKVGPLPEPKDVCPHCDGKLSRVDYLGDPANFPLFEGDFMLPAEEWTFTWAVKPPDLWDADFHKKNRVGRWFW